MSCFDLGLLVNTTIGNLRSAIYQFENVCLYRYMAIFGEAYGVRIGIFAMDDLKFYDSTLCGPALSWHNGSFTVVESKLPAYLESVYYISDQTVGKRYPKEIAKRLIDLHISKKPIYKNQLPSALVMNGLSEYAIPSKEITAFDQIEGVARLWKTCVLKPINGKRGGNVWFVDYTDSTLRYEGNDCSGVFTKDIWDQWQKDFPYYPVYLLQPRLDFHTKDGHAVDFRVLLSKGTAGEWEIISVYSRVGYGHIVSNHCIGGLVGYGIDVLQYEYDDTDHVLYQQVCDLGVATANAAECFLNGQNDTFYGIDIGVDRTSMHPYVIEINPYPGTKFNDALALAEKRIQYYRYLLTQKQ